MSKTRATMNRQNGGPVQVENRVLSEPCLDKILVIVPLDSQPAVNEIT